MVGGISVKTPQALDALNSEELWRKMDGVLRGSLLAVFVLVGAFILAADSLLPSSSQVVLVEGDVAQENVLAPRSMQYESDVLSQAKRDAAIASVRPVYDPPDTSVASEQLQLARQILDYVENVRYDDYASLEQKALDIEAIAALDLDPVVIRALLTIEDDNTWRSVDAQVVRLLQRVMGGEVREDNLQAVRDNLPNLISASYSDADVKIITGIVSSLIRVNTYFNEELTRQAELQASESVPVEMRTFARGQMIIREGEIATAAHIEALERFGLLRVTARRNEHFTAGLLAMTLMTVLLVTYIRKFHAALTDDLGLMGWLAGMFLLFLCGAQMLDADSDTQVYFFPAAALALLLTTLVGSQLAIVVNMALAVLAGFMSNYSLQSAVLISLSGTLGVLSLGRIERLNAYFMAGVVVWLVSSCVALFFALGSDDPPMSYTLVVQLLGSLANGLLSAAVALVGLYFVSSLLNIPTTLKILELSQPNHPLLQRLLREAPGTYQHSLQVANLAELGAQQIGANASLVRVAAMYHDIGKILNPHFFVENQANDVNPHMMLADPSASARIIIGHVAEGSRLARRYRLPHRLRDFIMEHHGTTQVMYFYRQAQEQAAQKGVVVSEAEFTYPGPRPQSRETAILMLADGCESSVRARHPQKKEDIQETVDYIFNLRLQTGELDDSGLTLNDLRLLRDSFLTVLQGVFHPRIAYPGTPSAEHKSLPDESRNRLVDGRRQSGLMTQEARVVGAVNDAISTFFAQDTANEAPPEKPKSLLTGSASAGDSEHKIS